MQRDTLPTATWELINLVDDGRESRRVTSYMIRTPSDEPDTGRKLPSGPRGSLADLARGVRPERAKMRWP